MIKLIQEQVEQNEREAVKQAQREAEEFAREMAEKSGKNVKMMKMLKENRKHNRLWQEKFYLLML